MTPRLGTSLTIYCFQPLDVHGLVMSDFACHILQSAGSCTSRACAFTPGHQR
jgi:hypothetical protein